ncbi:CbsB [Metallosphaera sedula]|uniref:Cytochrome b558/566 subunit B n=3 Tax=Metallosphaera TaxID=41980 RepID=A4YE26_METS5|nr:MULTISPECIES: cytochrome b558/566 subunit B [Metallosphaera]ABP94678.1 CbsB [Metallosphaera sedula DSM 5348]AIM26665.1 CbsB [Metallosphaera sedula]AKV73633.1 cytochrome b558/566 subunit B [Metallosphaera sedula]AKV75873.1 cytochrome b558/566 subunit B [Metallosphaera sedula]AKV78123.1 cytochrome b558/566 subunit B [Metallosphaera sedula]
MSSLRDESIKLVLVFLALASIFQFILQFIFSVSYLPIHIPFQNVLTRLGQIGIYLGYLSIGIFSILSWKKVKALLPLGILLLISPAFTLINNYFSSPLWVMYEVIVATLGILGVVESFLQAPILSLVNLPTAFMVGLLIVAGLLVDISHVELLLNYLLVFEVSLVSFLVYTVLWSSRNLSLKRASISYLASIPALFVFLPIYFLVSSNRFMDIIMNMVMPSVFGIVLTNPYSLPLFVISLAVAIYLSVTIALSRNPYAGLGYFMVITTVFLGVNGYHLILYMIYPIIGVILINMKEGKSRLLDRIINKAQNRT